MMLRFWAISFFSILMSACGASQSSETPHYIAEGNPPALSDWGMMSSDGLSLVLSEGVTPYDLNTPLFTDYAHKLRTIWMPEGVQAGYRENAPLAFPVGTVITKTFYYPRGERQNDVLLDLERADGWRSDGLELENIRLMETRILVLRDTGWLALPYVWNEDQTDAHLTRAGDIQHLSLMDDTETEQSFAYIVPNSNQCAGCHATNNTTREIQPIGPAARHMNRSYNYASGLENQMDHLVSLGYLDTWPGRDEAPSAQDYLDPDLDLSLRARDYLDINCAHCHNSVGAADTSGLLLEHDAPLGANLGLCKLPIAAGGGTGGHRYDIVPGQPDQSIFIYRMESTSPDIMMPELGRSLVHQEGVNLIRAWISSLDGECL